MDSLGGPERANEKVTNWTDPLKRYQLIKLNAYDNWPL